MKFFYLVFSLTLLFSSCKSDKIHSLQDVLDAFSPEEQVMTIDPAKDNMVEGENGTKVFIPANAFQFKDGSLPAGKIVVSLKEFFSISDFISNNLSTTSDGLLLETGGMLFISAASEGKELELNKNKSYVIAFPNKDTVKKMDSFYGVVNTLGQVNWTPAFPEREEGDPRPTATDTTSKDLYEYDQRFREKYSKYQDSVVEEIGVDVVNYSILTSGRLGWINCDRFLDDEVELTDFVVNTTGATGALVFITFDNIRSIMRGEEKNSSFIFRNMPDNSKIKVIGIAYRDGKPLLSKMPAVISKQPFILSGFNKFSLKELEKQLNSL